MTSPHKTNMQHEQAADQQASEQTAGQLRCQVDLPDERECPNCGLQMRLWAGFYRCRNCGFQESCCF